MALLQLCHAQVYLELHLMILMDNFMAAELQCPLGMAFQPPGLAASLFADLFADLFAGP